MVFIAAFTYWERQVLVGKPEFLRAREFVRSSVSVQKEFGDVAQVEQTRRWRYDVSITEPKDSSGYFTFSIAGKKASGEVTVYWKYTSGTQQFVATRLVRDLYTGGAAELTPR